MSAPSETPENPPQWTIPITYTTDEELDFETTSPKLFIKQDKSSIDIDLSPNATWVIFNIQQTGNT